MSGRGKGGSWERVRLDPVVLESHLPSVVSIVFSPKKEITLSESERGSFLSTSQPYLEYLLLNAHKLVSFEQTDQAGLASFLQSHDGRALESKIGFEILSDFSLTNPGKAEVYGLQQLGGFLVTTDFQRLFRACNDEAS
ncbi:hypothetical protein TNIN_145491 [Trichonephila inaurata madagascariensis]|uniref:Uncharacterized protein n=1 Tax=Trichonephila inaurata madagascariensis TaxID=2747483 RepID=A0A8X6WLY8_9ARAC|nr:hypothetical protein TNIN_145491 [Trichonephila inaurata madagascariensis]